MRFVPPVLHASMYGQTEKGDSTFSTIRELMVLTNRSLPRRQRQDSLYSALRAVQIQKKCHSDWRLLQFGLEITPKTFQRTIDVIPASARWEHALVNLNHIVVFSKSPQDHIGQMSRVLRLPCRASGTLKLNKFKFVL